MADLEERVAEFKEAFQMYDQNDDGAISIKELSEVMKVLGQILTEPELLDLVTRVVKDEKAETIQFADFLEIMAERLRDVDSEEELLAAFTVFDKDGTGRISVAELRHEMTKLKNPKLNDEEIDELIKEIDIFGDGTVKYDEMVKTLLATK